MIKKQFSAIRTGLVIISLFLFVTTFAQFSGKNPQFSSTEIVAEWYEWPHEGQDGNTVLKTQKYTPVPGIDRQEEPFVKLFFSNNGSCIITQYCGFCPNFSLSEKKGTYEIVQSKNGNANLKISFPVAENSISPEVISYSSDKLIMNLPPSLKAK